MTTEMSSMGLLIFSLGFFGVTLNSNFALGDCVLDFTKDFPVHAPLIFKSPQYEELISPKIIDDSGSKGVILIKNESVLLSCAGQNNHFEDTAVSLDGSPSQIVRCVNGTELSNGEKSYRFSSLGCQDRAKAAIHDLNSSCARNQGRSYEIGFEVIANSSDSFWYRLIELCFDVNDSVTYYSSHEINGEALSASEDEGNRPSFILGLNELYPDFSPNAVYKQAQQLITLTELIGEEKAEEVLNASYMSRGHLSPDGDFVFLPTAFATYFYVNVAPQFQNLNGGVWSQLEKDVRLLAMDTSSDYKIHTGTHDVLLLRDENNNDVEIYLYYDENEGIAKLPVPKFYWKVVEDPAKKEGIAFVSANNPLKGSNTDWPCTNVCSDYDWGTSSWTDELICCEVNDFLKTIVDTPDIEVNDVIRGLQK